MYHRNIYRLCRSIDVKDRAPTVCNGPHHLQIEVHPQLVHRIICIFFLIVEGLLSAQPFWDLEEFVQIGH